MKENENGVSPIIGVILIVAITVIMAAIIAAFVFGFSGSMIKQRVISVSAKQIDQNTISMIYMGGSDSADLQCIDVIILNSTGNYTRKSDVFGSCTATPPQDPVVGDMITFKVATLNKDHITATGVFKDNSKQVILDTWV